MGGLNVEPSSSILPGPIAHASGVVLALLCCFRVFSYFEPDISGRFDKTSNQRFLIKAQEIFDVLRPIFLKKYFKASD